MRVVLVGAALLVACGTPSTSPAEHLVVTTTIAPASVRAADPVTVRVVVSNQGTRSQTIIPGTCGMPAFVVEDQSGRFVGPVYRETCALGLTVKELAPGEEYVFPDRPWISDVPPDTYTLRGRVSARGGVVMSQPVSVTVTPYVAP